VKDLKNTIWKLVSHFNKNRKEEMEVKFLDGGYFEYEKFGSIKGGIDSKMIWNSDGKSIKIDLNDGFMVLLGEINSNFDSMQGTFENKRGEKGEWSGKFEKDLEVVEKTKEFKIITINEILQALYNSDLSSEEAEKGKFASKLRESFVKIEVDKNLAQSFKDSGSGGYVKEVDKKYIIEMEVKDFTQESEWKRDFLAHFSMGKLDYLPCEYSELEILEWINDGLSNISYTFDLIQSIDYADNENQYTSIGDLCNLNEEFTCAEYFHDDESLNFKLKKLSDLNPEWTDSKYSLEGENEFDNEGRLNLLRGW
jgi:hypothetical protein